MAGLATIVRAVSALCSGSEVTFTVSETEGVTIWRASCGERSATGSSPDEAVGDLLEVVTASSTPA